MAWHVLRQAKRGLAWAFEKSVIGDHSSPAGSATSVPVLSASQTDGRNMCGIKILPATYILPLQMIPEYKDVVRIQTEHDRIALTRFTIATPSRIAMVGLVYPIEIESSMISTFGSLGLEIGEVEALA